MVLLNYSAQKNAQNVELVNCSVQQMQYGLSEVLL